MFELHDNQKEPYQALCAKVMNVLLVGGSRSGKTFVTLFYILMRSLKYPGSRSLIARLHLNDLKGSIINDSLYPLCKLLSPSFGKLIKNRLNKQDYYLEFPNGSQIWFSGLGNDEQVEKVLGREYGLIFINEATQITYDTFCKIRTRLSHNTTPPLKFIVDCNPTTVRSWIYKIFVENRDPIDNSPKTKASYTSFLLHPKDNPHLPSNYIEEVLQQLPNRQRQRFEYGMWLEEVEGALWSSAMIDKNRATQLERSSYDQVIIGVDPAVTANPKSNETGIIVMASIGEHGYVLEDASGRYSPKAWAQKVSDLYRKYDATYVVAEINQGGQLVVDTLRNVDRTLPVQKVRAATGKFSRAEPIAALYEQNMIHHCGYFRDLEIQMTTYTASGSISPDRLDALVWGFYKLFVDKLNFYIINRDGVISV